MDVDAKPRGNFFHEKFVGLRRKIGMEHKRYAEGAEQCAGNKEADAPRNRCRREQAHKRHAAIQREAVKHGREKREQVRKAEAPEQGGHKEKDDGLQRVFHHAERHEFPSCGKLQIKYVGGRYHHGHAEIRPFHKGGAKRDGKDAEEIGEFRVKQPFFHQNRTLPKQKDSFSRLMLKQEKLFLISIT